MNAGVDAGAVIVAPGDGEPILSSGTSEIQLLLARHEVTVTQARYPAGESVVGPHIHHEHTDAFYVLDGKLKFQIGREAETIMVPAGGFVAVPPWVVHAFSTAGDGPARWLTIHARDGGFAAFMRGIRDGVKTAWDIAPVPADGGRPAGDALVSLDSGTARARSGAPPCRPRGALPDISVVEWRGALPPDDHEHAVTTLFVLEGELDAALAGTSRTVGAGTLVSIPGGVQRELRQRGPAPARLLSLHTPGRGAAGESPGDEVPSVT